MRDQLSRRHFVAAAAGAAALPLLHPLQALAAGTAAVRAEPFPLGAVKLLPGPFLDAAEINRRFLLGLDPDRLLHNFRVTAGLPSTAEPLGGWEHPDNELRGHFVGHYLSACALAGQSLSDATLRQRGLDVASELARCQKALGNGYLSAFPETFFDRLRADERVWAPFYTLHKILQGLLDTHTLSGSAEALDVAKRLAAWVGRWVDPLGQAHMARVLEREYGGMNQVLYDLAAATGDRGLQRLARRFDHERIFAPLAAGRDELEGLHANTQIPKIVGAARRYELLGDERSRRIASYFWQTVTERRSYCTGGTSNGERWMKEPGQLASELGGYTQECCCTYNMLKLTRHLFAWSADPRAADYYERALFNGILGTQHPTDGMTLYYVPLGSGYWKMFGQPLHSFWCCTGSGVESFAKLGDSVYFRSADTLYVNQFVASELGWPEKGLRLVQETRFPESDQTTLVMRCRTPVAAKLAIRVPYWATGGGSVTLNGRAIEGFASPSSYFELQRTWRDGDTLAVRLPMSLHVHAMPDDPDVQALMYGPLVLVGRLGTEGLTPELMRAEPTGLREVPRYRAEAVEAPALRAPEGDLARAVEGVPGRPLVFRTVGQTRDLELVPFYRLFDERYATYWKVVPA